jgi:hypothetical protein
LTYQPFAATADGAAAGDSSMRVSSCQLDTLLLLLL